MLDKRSLATHFVPELLSKATDKPQRGSDAPGRAGFKFSNSPKRPRQLGCMGLHFFSVMAQQGILHLETPREGLNLQHIRLAIFAKSAEVVTQLPVFSSLRFSAVQ